MIFKTRKKLKSYIKTLEEQLTMMVRDVIEQQETITRLSRENERLQIELDHANSTSSIYAKRCLKVMEYIKKHNVIITNKEYLPDGVISCHDKYLVDILQGEDK